MLWSQIDVRYRSLVLEWLQRARNTGLCLLGSPTDVESLELLVNNAVEVDLEISTAKVAAVLKRFDKSRPKLEALSLAVWYSSDIYSSNVRFAEHNTQRLQILRLQGICPRSWSAFAAYSGLRVLHLILARAPPKTSELLDILGRCPLLEDLLLDLDEKGTPEGQEVSLNRSARREIKLPCLLTFVLRFGKSATHFIVEGLLENLVFRHRLDFTYQPQGGSAKTYPWQAQWQFSRLFPSRHRSSPHIFHFWLRCQSYA